MKSGAQRRAGRHRRHERRGDRRDLRVDDLPRLLGALGKRHVALDARQPRAVVGHVKQPRLDRPAGSGRRRPPAHRLSSRPDRRASAARASNSSTPSTATSSAAAAAMRGSSRRHWPPPASESRNLMIASVIACTRRSGIRCRRAAFPDRRWSGIPSRRAPPACWPIRARASGARSMARAASATRSRSRSSRIAAKAID